MPSCVKAALILLGAWYVAAPAVNGSWLWDDDLYITHNPLLRDLPGLRKIWFDPPGMNYFPATATLQWCQWHLWGNRTLGYHLTNLVLHLSGAFLFWRLLAKFGLRQAWIGALLFAIHPLAVESVAWISELKNTLSLPLALLAMLGYVAWDEGGAGPPCLKYVASLFFFLLAMLSKSTVAMLPVVFLLYARWKRGRIDRRDLQAIAGFLVISLALGLVTVWFETHRAIGSSPAPVTPLASRLAVAGAAVVFYFCKWAVPASLLANYPQWAVPAAGWVRCLPWLAAGAVAVWMSGKRSGIRRSIRFGLGAFFVTLLPILGLIPMGYGSVSWVADHFIYFPMLGLAGLAAAGSERAIPRWPVIAALAVGAPLALIGHAHAASFHDGKALWTRTLEGNPRSWLASYNLGVIMEAEGRPDRARELYETTLRLNPNSAAAHNNFGAILAKEGFWDQAIAQFRQAVQTEPGEALYRRNLEGALRAIVSARANLP